MFLKKLSNGKYRYFEKFFDEKQNKWRQVTITKKSKSRVTQGEAKTELSLKISNIMKLYEEVEQSEDSNECLLTQKIFKEWRVIRNVELKASSAVSEEKSFSKFLEQFGSRKIQEIKSQEIQTFILGLHLSASTRTLRKTYYNLFFSYAKKVGYIADNPMERVVLPKARTTFEEVRKKKNKFLNKEEMRRILDYSYQNVSQVRKTMVYEFLFLTGLRIGELQALRWQDIDFEKRQLFVRHTLNVYGYSEQERQLLSPKTSHSYRSIYINTRCIEIVDYFRENMKDSDFIFVTEKGRMFHRGNLSKYFGRICQILDKDSDVSRTYNLHMLRHSHISLLIELGVPIKSIMERVGILTKK
ncbi:tyrosine-type recombinase/integrase [Lactococcus protaetiae]|uniref:tyrosine-type recombinase/integrase n=1 Tax=Lactococcus protaetiae TaxID=2592653 RepID=UPI001CC1D757|nr:site-specific integrase [Lactococcus protaetiae]